MENNVDVKNLSNKLEEIYELEKNYLIFDDQISDQIALEVRKFLAVLINEPFFLCQNSSIKQKTRVYKIPRI